MKKKLKIIILLVIISILLIGFTIKQNNDITITYLKYIDYYVPEDFQSYKILHVSDLHNKRFGRKQSKLLEKVEFINPDIILVTGDLIDSRHTNLKIAMDFVKGAIKIAPTYYVPGNHESRIKNYPDISYRLSSQGVNVLENDYAVLEKHSSQLALMGLLDPDFSHEEDYNYIDKNLESLTKDNERRFTILLSHRPELIDLYAKYQVNLVFAGHAHGGQIRLPFIGGLIAPDQGLFPKYTEGMYKMEKTAMVVSRGLGNSIFPIRLFNKPELVVIELGKPKG
ncbi:MAG TPA: metallophosphoesterase [Eubacteriaceae bacterium]|nr:metallophosphoesterase [Eubacteriaceae bacterium]